METKRRRLDSDGLWEYAVRILGGRAHSSGELRQKLKSRAERQGDVETTISRLKEAGYLDDRKFAEAFAATRLEDRQFGRMRVLRDLRQRHVAPTLAERTVSQVYQNVDEEALVENYVRRKFRSAAREGLFQDDREMASAYAKLLRAGFAPATVVRALKKFARNPELLDAFEPPAEMQEEPE
jgi:regulatory protein